MYIHINKQITLQYINELREAEFQNTYTRICFETCFESIESAREFGVLLKGSTITSFDYIASEHTDYVHFKEFILALGNHMSSFTVNGILEDSDLYKCIIQVNDTQDIYIVGHRNYMVGHNIFFEKSQMMLMKTQDRVCIHWYFNLEEVWVSNLIEEFGPRLVHIDIPELPGNGIVRIIKAAPNLEYLELAYKDIQSLVFNQQVVEALRNCTKLTYFASNLIIDSQSLIRFFQTSRTLRTFFLTSDIPINNLVLDSLMYRSITRLILSNVCDIQHLVDILPRTSVTYFRFENYGVDVNDRLYKAIQKCTTTNEIAVPIRKNLIVLLATDFLLPELVCLTASFLWG